MNASWCALLGQPFSAQGSQLHRGRRGFLPQAPSAPWFVNHFRVNPGCCAASRPIGRRLTLLGNLLCRRTLEDWVFLTFIKAPGRLVSIPTGEQSPEELYTPRYSCVYTSTHFQVYIPIYTYKQTYTLSRREKPERPPHISGFSATQYGRCCVARQPPGQRSHAGDISPVPTGTFPYKHVNTHGHTRSIGSRCLLTVSNHLDLCGSLLLQPPSALLFFGYL